MVYTLRFFSSNCSLFHNSNVFGSCIIHILYTGCAKIKKNNSGPKRLTVTWRYLLMILSPALFLLGVKESLVNNEFQSASQKNYFLISGATLAY